MTTKKMDLDVDDPAKVGNVLQNAIDAYYESASELEAAWQEAAAGRPWIYCAKALEKALGALEKYAEQGKFS